MIQSNVHKFCGFEDIISHLFIINKLLSPKIHTAKAKFFTDNPAGPEILALYYKVLEILSDKHLNYFITLGASDPARQGKATVKETKEQISLQTNFCIQKWIFCWLGTHLGGPPTGTPAAFLEENKINKYELIQFCLTISTDSVHVRRLLNGLTTARLLEIFGLSRYDLFTQIHGFVLSQAFVNLLNSYSQRDRLYNSIVLENGLAWIVENLNGLVQAENLVGQEARDLDRIFGLNLKIFDFLVRKNFRGANGCKGVIYGYQKNSV